MKRKKHTLGDEYGKRGLMRPTQFKRHPPPWQHNSEQVTFLWGETRVRGFREVAEVDEP